LLPKAFNRLQSAQIENTGKAAEIFAGERLKIDKSERYCLFSVVVSFGS
jgi:hypothetical protein